LRKHIEGLTRQNSPVSRFESAADAVVTGDVAKLNQSLGEDPELVRERSAFLHHATLLHYVGANGVKSYRQKTPKNAVRIAEVLLRAGADINVVADIYGGSDTLGLAATSVWPFLRACRTRSLIFCLNTGPICTVKGSLTPA